MGDVIGRAYVEVIPEVTKFARQLTKDLNKQFRNFKKITVGVSAGSVAKAFREVTKLNTALRVTTLGLVALAGKAAVAGFFSVAQGAIQLSGALGVVPAAAAAAAVGMGAFAVGLNGVGAALKQFLKGNMDKFNEQLQKLSPQAQKTLGVLNLFKPVLDKFKTSVQDAFFSGLEPVAKNLGNTFLPRVKDAFVDIGGSANLAVKGIAGFLLQKSSVQDIDATFGNIRETFRRLAPAGTFVAQALLDIVKVGSGFLPQIASELTTASVKFRDFIARARASGALEDFFRKGIEAAHKLINIISNLFQGVVQIFRVANQSGFGFLDTLQKLATGFNNFVHSSQGVEELTSIFTSMRQAVQAITPVAAALFKVFSTGVLPLLANFATIVGPSLARFIDDFGKALKIAEPGILTFAKGFGEFLDAVRPALQPLAALVGVLGTYLGGVLATLGPLLQRFITLLVDQLLAALLNPALVNAFFDLVEAFANLLIAVIPLIGPLTQLAVQVLPLLVSALVALAPVLTPIIGIVGNLVAIFAPLLQVLNALIGPLAGFLTGVGIVVQFLTSNVPVVLALLGAFVVGAGAFGVALNLMGASAAATGSKLVKFGEVVAKGIGLAISPLGIAVTAAAAVLTVFGIQSEKAAQEQQKFTSAAQGVVAVIREQNGVMNDAVRIATAKAAADTGLFETAQKIGISSQELTDALLGNKVAMQDVADRTQQYVATQSQLNGPLSDNVQEALKFGKGVETTTNEIEKGKTQNQLYQEALGQSSERVKEATGAFAAWADELNKVYDGLVKTGQIQLTLREATRNYAEAVEHATETIANNGKNLDVNTQKGRENQAALDGIAQKAISMETAQRNAGASTEALQAFMVQARADFIKNAEAAGYNATEANALADKLQLIPGNYHADISVTGTEYAIGQVTTLHGKLIDLTGRTYIASVSVGISGPAAGGGKLFPGLAEGGNFRTGQVAVVGENGPEIVRFGGSGRVFSNTESKAIARNVDSLTARGGHQAGVSTDAATTTAPVDLTLNVDLGADVRKVVKVQIDEQRRATVNAVRAGVGGAR